ncbi:MAG: arginine--tRNA ligase [Deltaproteobacteria bacterium RIFCSPHIGHO2_12_FULL_43_9]|nr:MAG: arginine--tRNA ligase [Deltaproteobacteria bacterium RIFCSPHIGHO2_12_FULL_43_9]
MNQNQSLQEVIRFISAKLNISEVEVAPFIEFPPEKSMGEYAFPCFILAKKLKTSPQKIAESLAEGFFPTEFLKEVKVVGGYLNFFVQRENYIKDILSSVLKEGGAFGKSDEGKGKMVVIDYSSPNIAKPFSIGHLRSTIIGQALANLFRSASYKVVGINHIGDWGTQFGKQIVALKKFGSVEDLKNAKDPIVYLFDLYVKFHKEAEKNPSLEDEAREMFAKTERGDKEATELRDLLVDYSLKAFNKTYKRLGIEFTHTRGESYYADKVEPAFKKIEKLTEVRESEGALVIDLDSYGLTPLLLKKRDGTTLYATRDLTALFDRFEEFNFNQMLYVVGQEQTLHFNQLFSALEKMKIQWVNRCHHIPFGMIRFKDKKMSTREGNVIFLEQVLDEAKKRAKDAIEKKNPELKDKDEVAEAVGTGAVIFNDLSQRMIKDVIFDWDQMLNFEGDTGPYLQYTCARISSIIKKSGSNIKEIDWSRIQDDESFQIVRALEQIPIAISNATKAYEPSILCSALLFVASAFNTFYHKHRVIQEDKNVESARLALLKAVLYSLKNGLQILNIKAPEEM